MQKAEIMNEAPGSDYENGPILLNSILGGKKAPTTPAPEMKKIVVLDTETKIMEVDKLQADDRKKFYDEAAEKDKTKPFEVYNNYYLLNEDDIVLKDIMYVSSVPELMFRQAILQSYFLYFYKQGIRPYTPYQMLITVPPSSEIILEPVIEEVIVKQDIMKTAKKQEIRIDGGANAPPFNSTTNNNTGMKIRFEHPVQCRMPSGALYTASPSEEINIIAIIMRPICSSIGLREKQTLEDSLVAGNYNLSNLSSDRGKYFDHPYDFLPKEVVDNSIISVTDSSEAAKDKLLKEFGVAKSETHKSRVESVGLPFVINTGSAIIPIKNKNYSDIESIMKSIINYVEWFMNYYSSGIASNSVIEKISTTIDKIDKERAANVEKKGNVAVKSIIEEAIEGGERSERGTSSYERLENYMKDNLFGDVFVVKDKKGLPISNKMHLSYFIEESKLWPETLKNKNIRDVISIIENITKSSISLLNSVALVNDLRRLGVYNIYYLSLVKGPDSKEVKTLIEQLKFNYETTLTQNAYLLKRKEESSRASVYMRLLGKIFGAKRQKEVNKALRLLPYKTTKDIVGVLSKRESTIIEKEFEQRQNFEKNITENKCPHVQILMRFMAATSMQYARAQFILLSKFFRKDTGNVSKNAEKSGVYLDERYFIKCTSCGFDILCPHMRELTEINLGIEDYKNEKLYNAREGIKMSTSEIVKTAMNKYLDDRSTKGGHYCSICAGEITGMEYYDSSMGDFDVENYSSIKDELKNDIWKELIGIMGTMHFGSSIKTSHVTSMTINGIHEYIKEVENQLKLSRTNSADDIKNKKRIFVIIYCYAYLIHFVIKMRAVAKKETGRGLSSPLSVVFSDYNGDVDNTAEYIKYAVVKIAKTRAILIKSVPNITIDFIKNKIIDAYKLISTKGIEEITLTNENHYRLLLLDADAIYDFYYLVNSLSLKMTISLKGKASFIPEIIGVPIIKLDTLSSLYAKTKIIDIRKGKNPVFKGVDGALSKLKRIKYLEPIKATELESASVDSFILSYEIFADYVNLYRNSGSKFPNRKMILNIRSNTSTTWSNMLNSTGETYRNDSQIMGTSDIWDAVTGGEEYHKNFPADFDAKAKSHIERRVKILQESAILREHILSKYLLNVVSLYTAYDPYFKEQKVLLSAIFDENGEAHKWTVLIIKRTNAPKKGGAKSVKNAANTEDNQIEEITGDALLKELESGNAPKYNIIDRKCSVCGVLRKETSKLSESKIESSRARKIRIENFFKFFFNKCPIVAKDGNIMHEWKADTCIKCGLKYGTLFNVSSKEGVEYYEKYSEEFEKEETANTTHASKHVDAPHINNYSKLDAVYNTWTFNFDNIIELARATSTNQNMINALGAFEGVDKKDIMSGKFVPPEPENTTNPRVYTIQSYIRSFIIEYEQLRNFSSVDKPPANLVKLIEDNEIESHLLPNLSNILPPSPENWNLLITYFLEKKKAREAVTFALEVFSVICMDVFNGVESSLAANITIAENAFDSREIIRGAKWTKKNIPAAEQKIKNIREEFVKDSLKKILGDEELKTKPGEVNWNKLRKDKSITVEEIMDKGNDEDPNVAADFGIQTNDGLKNEAAEDKEGDYGTTDDAFKNHFDVDIDPSETMDDFENEIGVDDTGTTGIE